MNLATLSSKALQHRAGVYKLSIVEHSYIGSSKNLYARLHEHRHDLQTNKHPNEFMQKTVNKYGIDAVDVEIMEFCEPSIRLQREKYWITQTNPDMNFKDPVTCTLSEASRIKLSESIRKGRAEGKYQTKYMTSTIECYDYFGDYITTFSTIAEAAATCSLTEKDVKSCLGAYKHGTKPNGSSIGKAVHGYRFRYTCSKVPPRKFHVNPHDVGRIFNFYYLDSDGKEQFAFSGYRDMWNFLAQHCRDKQIVIIPKLKSRESWDLLQKQDNHNASASEME